MIDLEYFVGQVLVLVDPECEIFIFWNHGSTFNVVQRHIHSANYGRQSEYTNVDSFTNYQAESVSDAVAKASAWWTEQHENGPE
jgi:hypothetical protein